MSTFSDTIPCPNCGKEANRSASNKPFDYETIDCDHCGLVVTPNIQFRDLEELNEVREVLDNIISHVLLKGNTQMRNNENQKNKSAPAA